MCWVYYFEKVNKKLFQSLALTVVNNLLYMELVPVDSIKG